ncbi:MAG: hypothetical protein MUO42_05105, partial [Anaerolineaceae bacterium]|nr:hypothetical protein [Anaerolineaceae bacterium]
MTKSLKEIFRYPSVVVGLMIILLLIVVSIYTVITIPYSKAVQLWRGNEVDWYQNPKTAAPVWYNWFRRDKLPETIVITTEDPEVTKTIKETESGRIITILMPVLFNYDTFAEDIAVYFKSDFNEDAPFIGLKWIYPDGKEIGIGNFSIDRKFTLRLNQDKKITTKLKGLVASHGLFIDPDGKNKDIPLKGKYTLKIEAITFDKTADV